MSRTSFKGVVPKCSTAAQYALWKKVARGCSAAPGIGFCEDCTPSYQRNMKAEERCENPGIRFFFEPPRRVRKMRNGVEVWEQVGGFLYGAFKPGSHTDQMSGEVVIHAEIAAEPVSA